MTQFKDDSKTFKQNLLEGWAGVWRKLARGGN
nr:MAG TPA: hypothetical protein [Bacteriophage sp.]